MGDVYYGRASLPELCGEDLSRKPAADQIFGISAYKDLRDVEGPVDLAVLAIPEESVEETIASCCQKKVKGITIITAGFGETSEHGQKKQEALADLARENDIRLLGPNVSGTFNLYAGFNASATPAENLLQTPISAVCQGGYAFYDILSSGWARGLGVGKFIHTGNECDLTVTDFLEYFGRDPEVKSIIMYIEAIRDGRALHKGCPRGIDKQTDRSIQGRKDLGQRPCSAQPHWRTFGK